MTLLPLENPGYVDAGYLELVARTMAELKALSYDRMRAAPGMRVLDVGCGPATDTLALAARVAPDGFVVGVDYDPGMVAEAERRAAAAGIAAHVSHRVGDAQALPFGDGDFHAARCERLFQHLPDPDAAARELVRVVRPGGRVVAVDTDFGTLSIDSAHPRRERRVVEALARDTLLNGYSGRRLFGQLRRAGLCDVQVEAIPVVTHSYAFARTALRLDQVETAVLHEGGEAELAAWRAEMEEADAAGAFFASVNVVVASGTRRAR
jgi:SAM-dependent methyltransferase